MADILINDTVKKYLLKQSKDLKERLREKFEFLENGIWDGGLQVKKIKGVSSKCIFEARLDRDNRILFTLGREKRDKKQGALVIFVWGIVDHDQVSRTTRNIIPENVPFLHFRKYDELLLENIDMEELDSSFFTQEGITEKVADESGSQRWYSLDEPEWQRIRQFSRDDLEMFLYLTPGQREILETALPVMISGTAGSGKTTLSIYYLLNRNLGQKKKIYITYNRHLKDFARRLYNGLLNEREWRDEVSDPAFYTFKDLCLEIAADHGKHFPLAREVDFHRFMRLFSVHPHHTRFDPALVWEEIRSIIKGALAQVNVSILKRALKEIKTGKVTTGSIKQLQQQFILFSRLKSLEGVEKFVSKYLNVTLESFCAHIEKHLQESADRVQSVIARTIAAVEKQAKDKDGDRKYLSFLEYELLGKKKAPNFKYNRKEIYSIFEWYQDRLKREHLWDELDLCRVVTRIFPGRDMGKYSYDILVCDEIQDFTDMQLDLLFHLVKNPKNIFFAGDSKQIVNPSGFRWEEVRRHFFERGLEVPPLKYLSLNFRSSGSIVELSNTLLELKEKFTGSKAEEAKEEWKYKGRPVVVVSDIRPQDMLDTLRAAGAKRTVIVRSEAEKSRLQDLLGTELVFTIAEAKGLEFDTVVIWKFCDDELTKDVWRVALDMSKRNIHEAKIKHEINLLYVGITRCKRDLIIYDGKKPALLWKSEQLQDHVFVTSDRDFIDTVWNVLSTKEEWVEQGHYFFERGYFRAARECFKNGEDMENYFKASAFLFEKEKNYRQAARHFEKLNEKERAAENWERAREFKSALALWKELKRDERIFPCRIRVLEQENKFAEAARLYLKKKQYKEALENFKKSAHYREAAELCLHKLKNSKEAAHCFELAGEHEQAALLYNRLKSYKKAAELYTLGKNFKKAERLWIKLKDTKSLLQLYRQTDQNDKLFEIYEKQKDFDNAVKYLKQLPDKSRLEEEAEQFFASRRYFRALVRFYVLGDHEKTAECYLKKKDYEAAAKHFKLAGNFYAAGHAHLKLKNYYDAVDSFLLSEEDEQADFAMAKKTGRKFFDYEWLYKRGVDCVEEGEVRKALALFSGIYSAAPEQGICHALLGDKEQAHSVWQKCSLLDDYEQLAAVCLDKELVEVAGTFFLELAEKYRHRFDTPFSKNQVPPSIRALMESYFNEYADADKMHAWAKFIGDTDWECRHWNQVLFYMERVGDYNYLVSYFNRFGWLEKGKDFLDKLKDLFDLRIPSLIQEENWQSLALWYLVLERETDLADVVAKIEITPHNYGLIARTGDYERAVEWCIENNKIGDAGLILRRHGQHQRAGELQETHGKLFSAAHHYQDAGLFEKAAALFDRKKDYKEAGDLYYKAKNFRAALAAYAKLPPQDNIKRKIARTYEKLGEYERALEIWQDQGKARDIERCKKKIAQAAQRSFDFPPEDDKRRR